MSFRNVFLAGLTGASALVPPLQNLADQLPLGSLSEGISSAQFQCDLPPVIDPANDGLPSADKLFSSEEALVKQIERHQAVVRVPTVSYDDNGEPGEDERWTPFLDLHKVLESLYPRIHKRATLEKVNTLGLVYTIEGLEPSLKPTLLAAHQDVVPVPDASTWTHPPFAAVYDGEWLWGRGASDDKNSLTALMSAVEALLSDDQWQPTRTLVLAFGFDEECSGYRGAASIGKFLTERFGDDGVAVILDEGGLGMQLIENNTLYAFPAVMEKGHLDVWFELSVVGGHSSVPFPHTGIGIIAEIISKLEANPYEPQLLDDSPVHRHLQCLAHHSPGFAPEITRLVEAGDLEGLTQEVVNIQQGSRFMIQTSQSVDLVEGGQKINAMPEHVKLGVNYRIAPQNSMEEVQHNIVKHIQSVVDKFDLRLVAFEGDQDYQTYLSEQPLEGIVDTAEKVDYNGTLTIYGSEKFHTTPVSPTDNEAWKIFAGTIRHIFQFEGGEVVPVGEIMTGNTDTRHYLNLSPNIYRWTPNTQAGSVNIHTIDERIRMDAHMDMVKFYYDFVRNFDQAKL